MRAGNLFSLLLIPTLCDTQEGAWHITSIDKYLLSEWIIGIDQIKTVLLYRWGERIHEPILNNYFCEIFKVFMLIKMNHLKRLD